MSEVTLATASERQRWIRNYFAEYVREAKFGPSLGRSNNNIIVAKYELQEEAGKTINLPLITRLTGAGVTGSQVLAGAEEDLGNYNFPLSVDWRRNGVRIPKSTSYKTQIDLFNAARDMLKSWEAEKLRNDIIDSMLAVWPLTTTTTQIKYGTWTAATGGGYEITSANYTASEANKDAWLVLNSDRVLYGAAIANGVSGDSSTSLATLDTTADKLSVAIATMAKRMAKGADPHIRPFRISDGREFFVMFCNSRSFRDLQADSAMLAANRDARTRDVQSNPIFQDGDLIYNGIIFREIEEIPTLKNAGASGTTDVGPNFLCGAQAVGIAWGQEPTPQTDNLKDYKFRPGVAIEELVGVSKICFNGKQQGMVTVFCAAAPDA